MSSNLQWEMLPGVKVTLAQRTRHSTYWAEQNKLPPEAGAFKYLALGDSVAIGVGLDDVQGGYVPQLARRVSATLGRPTQIVNIAFSGATISQLIQRQIPLVQDHADADLVTCIVGANDIAWVKRFDEEHFREQAFALASKLPGGTVLGLIPSFWHSPFEHRVRRANQQLTEAAAKYGHTVADIYTPTRSQSVVARLRNASADGFHPNAAGYALWTEALWQVIEPMLPARCV